MIFPYNSLYTQAAAYTTYFQLGEPVVAFMFFMLEILDELLKLSLTFQKDEVAVIDVNNALERTRQALNALLARPGTQSRTFEQSLNGNSFETVTLNKHLIVNDDGELTNLKNRIVNAISQYLANRFDNFERDPVLIVAKILEVEHWPNDHEKLSVFGEEESMLFLTTLSICLKEMTLTKRQPCQNG